MRERVRNFMAGRYGFDELSKLYLSLTVVSMAVSMFIKNRLLYMAALAVLIYCYCRAFSKNIAKRQQEEEKYLAFCGRSAAKWRAFKNRQAQKKIYRFYKCPQCSQRVRIPKGRGRICITCPKCQAEFIKKS